jgi:hypothetical protein
VRERGTRDYPPIVIIRVCCCRTEQSVPSVWYLRQVAIVRCRFDDGVEKLHKSHRAAIDYSAKQQVNDGR